MAIKQNSKIQHWLLVVVLLLNPIVTSAEALFSANTSLGMSMNTTSIMNSDVQMQSNCHDESVIILSQGVNNNSDCCSDPCGCEASGCHATPVIYLQVNHAGEASLHYSPNYFSTLYLSYKPSPSSPPPIA